MFRKIFGKSQLKVDEHAVAALMLLDRAIIHVHPKRFVGDLDAAMYLNSPRIALNAFLGRPQPERFFPVSYEQLLIRFADFQKNNLLREAMKLTESDKVVHAVMRGIWHEYKLLSFKHRHSRVNLGKEVQNSTNALIDFLNRNASTKLA